MWVTVQCAVFDALEADSACKVCVECLEALLRAVSWVDTITTNSLSLNINFT